MIAWIIGGVAMLVILGLIAGFFFIWGNSIGMRTIDRDVGSELSYLRTLNKTLVTENDDLQKNVEELENSIHEPK